MAIDMDKSNGYEGIAKRFVEVRGQFVDGIGASLVREWARTLPQGSTVLDLGCGTGFPISKVLTDEGLDVYGIDASPTLISVFRQHFPDAPAACEAVEDSLFFNRKFDGIIAWGLLFLLSEEAQAKVISTAGSALQKGGKLLFTAPHQKTEWEDVMTGLHSSSLGVAKYGELLSASGLSLVEEFKDEGENHYFSAIKL